MSFRRGLGYLDERTFRYNNRATAKNARTGGDRFNLALSKAHGQASHGGDG